MKRTGVYGIRHTESGRYYVGSSVDIDRRFRQHTKLLLKGVHPSGKLQREFDVCGGIHAFTLTLLETTDDLAAREEFWIERLSAARRGYNSRTQGLRPTAEQLEKLRSGARRAALNRTPEHRENLSKWQKGKPKSEQHVEAIRKTAALRRGVPNPMRDSARAALSAAKKGKPQPEANRQALTLSRRAKSAIPQTDIDKIKERYVPHCKVNGATAIAREYGVSQALISSIISGKRRGETI